MVLIFVKKFNTENSRNMSAKKLANIFSNKFLWPAVLIGFAWFQGHLAVGWCIPLPQYGDSPDPGSEACALHDEDAVSQFWYSGVLWRLVYIHKRLTKIYVYMYHYMFDCTILFFRRILFLWIPRLKIIKIWKLLI